MQQTKTSLDADPTQNATMVQLMSSHVLSHKENESTAAVHDRTYVTLQAP